MMNDDINVVDLGNYVTSDGLSVELVCETDAFNNIVSYGYNVRKTYNVYFNYHRIGEPAYIDNNTGYITFDVEGHEYDSVREYCEACGFDEEITLCWVLKYGETLPSYREEF